MKSQKHALGIPTAIVVALAVLALAVAASYAMNGSPAPAGSTSPSVSDPAVAAHVKEAIAAMMTPETLDAGSAAMGGLSSNPYDYVTDNPEFDELVALGYDALPALEAELNASPDSGLREYMICIAIEKITRCDLKQFGESQWDSARSFKSKWPTYLKSVPTRVRAILTSKNSDAEKNRQIAQLGAPAIPFVIDNISLVGEADDEEMTATLTRIMGNAVHGDSVGEFASRNASRVERLREYVEGR